MWIYGYKGDLNVGLYDNILLSRITITEILTKEKRTRPIVEAILTRLLISRNAIAHIMKREVSIIDTKGVLNLILTLEKIEGSKLSFAIASGLREAAIRPAFAVVIKANIPAIIKIIKPVLPNNCFAASDIGVRDAN